MSRSRAYEPKEIEARTEAMRNKKSTKVDYEINCTLEHSGISGRITGRKIGNTEIVFYLDGPHKVREDQLDSVIAFLNFARNESDELRRAYQRLDREAA
jgi:hypothetical protein